MLVTSSGHFQVKTSATFHYSVALKVVWGVYELVRFGLGSIQALRSDLELSFLLCRDI